MSARLSSNTDALAGWPPSGRTASRYTLGLLLNLAAVASSSSGSSSCSSSSKTLPHHAGGSRGDGGPPGRKHRRNPGFCFSSGNRVQPTVTSNKMPLNPEPFSSPSLSPIDQYSKCILDANSKGAPAGVNCFTKRKRTREWAHPKVKVLAP